MDASLFLVPYCAPADGLDALEEVPDSEHPKCILSALLFARLDESLRVSFKTCWCPFWLVCLASGLFVLGVSPALLLGLAAAVLSWIPYLGSVVAAL